MAMMIEKWRGNKHGISKCKITTNFFSHIIVINPKRSNFSKTIISIVDEKFEQVDLNNFIGSELISCSNDIDELMQDAAFREYLYKDRRFRSNRNRDPTFVNPYHTASV